ncbi:hypothetical protein FHR24_001237 [Wenyingzhuangia heitensis]|uniref:Lipocalin-like domain-containing protein n=1 Tax=Wenyingzhuangia heitensis TaxID=1487859 RepID=A0ABX0U7R5_9FLAO|nr:hypothetical protein [Wenyingzhuangia heitensis]NIJ44798.1 hypothetical protein [Wenyingzhuangia heitensis]
MKNKVLYIYTAIVIACTFLVSLAIHKTKNPTEGIVGTWKEVEWRYEKIPHKNTPVLIEENKKQITEDLMIHKAELWQFLPNGEIKLTSGKGGTKLLNWTLKGRGHVLKLTEKNVNNEHYNLYYIGNNTMELHFRTDLQAKGIVKLTFKRINNTTKYAQEI